MAGTGTDVGKTWVSARLLTTLRAAGATVAARKPAQSFDPGDDPAGFDSAVLGAASGEASETVCRPAGGTRWPWRRPMAADVLGRGRFTLAELVRGTGLADAGRRGRTGGDGRRGALAADPRRRRRGPGRRRWRPTSCCWWPTPGWERSTRFASRSTRCPAAAPVVVVLNRYDEGNDLHVRNRRWLTEEDGLAVVTMPGGEEAAGHPGARDHRARCRGKVGRAVRSGRRGGGLGPRRLGPRRRRPGRPSRRGPGQRRDQPGETHLLRLGRRLLLGGLPARRGGDHRLHRATWPRRRTSPWPTSGAAGATTTSIIDTVGCPDVLPHTAGARLYPTTTQAAAAEAFLTAHRGHIGLITVSIGGNDVTACAAAGEPDPLRGHRRDQHRPERHHPRHRPAGRRRAQGAAHRADLPRRLPGRLRLSGPAGHGGPHGAGLGVGGRLQVAHQPGPRQGLRRPPAVPSWT